MTAQPLKGTIKLWRPEDATPCFYCDEPIGSEPRVIGDKADAHRRCVHARLDKLNPRWREHVDIRRVES